MQASGLKSFSTVAPLDGAYDADFDDDVPSGKESRHEPKGGVKDSAKRSRAGPNSGARREAKPGPRSTDKDQTFKSEVVPLDLDSDDDFKPGALAPPPATRGRGRRKKIPRVEELEAHGHGHNSPSPARSGRKKPLRSLRDLSPASRAAEIEVNPLLGFLGEDFELLPRRADTPVRKAEPKSEKLQSRNASPAISESHALKRKAEADLDPPSPKRVKREEDETETEIEDSETETETDPDFAEDVIPGTVMQGPVVKTEATRQADSETETEYEDDELEIPSSSHHDSGKTRTRVTQGLTIPPIGSTASKSQGDETLGIRPQFAATAEQSTMGPLILDPAKGIEVPAAINRFLREYQRDGVRFFYDGYKDGKGRLLGDDMGLGKTIQVISFLSAIMKRAGDARDQEKRREHVRQLQRRLANDDLPAANSESPTCLIIVPASLVDNWAREIETWGYFEYAKYTNSFTKAEKRDMLKDFKMGRLDIVLTSHDCARRDIDVLYDLPWSCIFIDEAHKVKNPKSEITVAVHKFKHGVRFGITGTAIQNDYEEFWTILDWTNPGRLGTLSQWSQYISGPLKLGQSSSSTAEQQQQAQRVKATLVEKLLPKFFLRRTKDLIKHQLPKKTDNVVFCPLTERQTSVYKAFLNHPDVKLILRNTEPCDCGSEDTRGACCHKYTSDGQPWSHAVLKFMTIFIKLSNHVALAYPSGNDSPEQLVRNKANVTYIEETFPDEKEEWLYARVQYAPTLCGKWDVLSTFLAEWKADGKDKVLIFSKSVKLLDIIETFVQHAAYDYCRLDGKLPPDKRLAEVDRFNNDPSVFLFLISTVAGGTGLNLTAANKVVIFDPSWNPAHDLQAMDRAYRIGQNRDVSVYRLLGAGSLEELIYARQLYKQAQMRIAYEGSDQRRYWAAVQGLKIKQGELFGIKNIFSLHETGLVVKSTIEKRVRNDFCWILEHVEGVGEDEDAADLEDPEHALSFLFEQDPTASPTRPRVDRGSQSDGAERDVKRSKKRKPKKDAIGQYLEERNIHAHVNEQVIAGSSVEAARLNAKAAKRDKAAAPSVTDDAWIPKRAPRPTAKRFEERFQLLQELGSSDSQKEMTDAMNKVSSMTEKEQRELMAKLDAIIEHRKKLGKDPPRV